MFQKLIAKFDLWFIPEWRKCLRMFSVQFVLVSGLLMEAAQSAMPAEVQAMIPQPYGRIAVGLWTLLGMYGRLKSQAAVVAPPTGPTNG